MFAREGYAYLVVVAALATLMFVATLRFRSWPMWLAAFGLTILTLCVAWYFRAPRRVSLVSPAGITLPVSSLATSLRPPSESAYDA